MDAARAVFIARGYGAAKVDDIARAAGVSKGTVYLYYPNKQALFEAVMRAGVVSVIQEAAEALAAADHVPAADRLRALMTTMYGNVVGTDTRRLMHLIMTEGANFPELLAFYHREVIAPGMKLISDMLERGAATGEFQLHGVERHPKIILGPALMAAVYANLFGGHTPQELADYRDTHIAAVLRMLGAA